MNAALARCPHAIAHAALATLPPGARARCPCGAWVEAPVRVVQVYRAPLDAGAAPSAVVARTRSKLDAARLELERVRLLLSELRPDCVEPLMPPPKPLTAVPQVHVRDPQAGWGGVPAGLGETGTIRVGGGGGGAALLAVAVLDRIAALPPDARAVCTWLREHGELLDRGRLCLRGLYYAAGKAFAGDDLLALWEHDLTAQRDGAAALGRRVVLAAAAAWEQDGAR